MTAVALPPDQMVHLRCTRTQRLYRVLAIDPVEKVATLKGKLGEFTQPWDREALQAMGYQRVNGPVEGAIEV